MLTAIAFYIFAAVLLLSAATVVAARNPIYAVLALILAFFNAAGLFLLAGAEFLAMLLIIVYVGAVAVLFLFVVMMLGAEPGGTGVPRQRYVLAGAVVGGVLALELVLVSAMHWHSAAAPALAAASPAGLSNTVALGSILYTDYIYGFQIAGLVLLVAMIGAIVLALRARPGVRHQSGWRQVSREAADAVDLVDIKPGRGA